MPNVLEEYLISLGFQPDEPALRKFKGVMADAEGAVASHSSGMVKRVLEAQGAILGTFTSISAAIIGTADHAAMADQSYRLLGLRMLMTTESARKMDLITKALGADLGTIVWDPELHARAVMMGDDIDRMGKNLGPGFEGGMKGIRDLHAELDRLSLGAKFLGYQFAYDLWRKLAPGDSAKSLHDWVTDMQGKIPHLSDQLTNYAIPTLRQTWEMLKQVEKAAEAGAVAFTNVIAALSGDKSISGTAFSFENIAKAIQHVGDWMVKFFGWITKAEEVLGHFASASALAARGDWEGAKKEFQTGRHVFDEKHVKHFIPDSTGFMQKATEGFRDQNLGALKDALDAAYKMHPTWDSTVKPKDAGAPGVVEATAKRAFIEFSRFLDEHLSSQKERQRLLKNVDKLEEKWFGPAIKPAAKPVDEPKREPTTVHIDDKTSARADYIAAIESAADRYGISRSLALAVAKKESDFQQNQTSRKGAVGIMQLMPDTAKDLGVDPKDAQQNIEGGVHYLAQLLERYQGDTGKAIAAYNAGMGTVDRTPDFAKLPAETRAYVPKVLEYQKTFEREVAPAPVAEPATPPAHNPEPMAYIREAPKFQPVWLQPPADDAAPKPVNPMWDLPKAPSIMDRDWAPVMASLQRPIMPQANISTNRMSSDISGGVHVYVTEPGADARTIQRAVAEGVREALADQTQLDLAQINPAY